MVSKTMKYRDVITHNIENGHILVTGCDSCGGIGQKSQDVLNADPFIVGFITARVALLEVLTLGANIVGVTVPISCEPTPTGERILDGVKACLGNFRIECPVLMSMEKNMETHMTAAGVVATGVTQALRLGKINSNDQIFVVGRPSVGQEVLDYENELFNVSSLKTLMDNSGVKELLPVGSTGVLRELECMMQEKNKIYELLSPEKINSLDLNKSCGPSSAVIVIAQNDVKLDLDVPVVKIGKIL